MTKPSDFFFFGRFKEMKKKKGGKKKFLRSLAFSGISPFSIVMTFFASAFAVLWPMTMRKLRDPTRNADIYIFWLGLSGC